MAVKLKMKTFRTAKEVEAFTTNAANNVASVVDVKMHEGTYMLWYVEA